MGGYAWATAIPRVVRQSTSVSTAMSPALAKDRRLRMEHAGGWAGVYGRDSHSGRSVTTETALELSAVWSCIRQSSQTIATLPLVLEEIDERGVRTRVDDRLSDVLTMSPNAHQTATEFWEGQVAWLLANGNCYAERVYTGRRLSALQPIPALACEPIEAAGSISYRVLDRGREEVLPADKVFHVRGFGFGGMKGLSAIRYGVQSIGAGLAADESAGRLFANGMQGAGFFKFSQTLDDQQREQFQALMDAYSGSSKAGKAMLLEAGIDWQQAQLNPEDAQMLETRRFAIEDICRWFGVPPIVIGHSSEGQTMWGSGVESILINWMATGLNPLMRRIEARMRRDLIRPERPRARAEWNREGILQMESKAKAEFLQKMVNGGIMTPNEARGKLNLPRIAAGDVLLVQGAMISLDELLARPPAMAGA